MKRLLTFCVALMLATGVHAAELGDDGLHKTPWMRDTFKDLREDLEEAGLTLPGEIAENYDRFVEAYGGAA